VTGYGIRRETGEEPGRKGRGRHSQYPWSEIGRRLGLPKHQAISRFRRLLVTAGIQDHGEIGET
jgi:hypothetical protein